LSNVIALRRRPPRAIFKSPNCVTESRSSGARSTTAAKLGLRRRRCAPSEAADTANSRRRAGHLEGSSASAFLELVHIGITRGAAISRACSAIPPASAPAVDAGEQGRSGFLRCGPSSCQNAPKFEKQLAMIPGRSFPGLVHNARRRGASFVALFRQPSQFAMAAEVIGRKRQRLFSSAQCPRRNGRFGYSQTPARRGRVLGLGD